jgi:hypothetical protein
MILYVNGDGHTGGSMAVNPFEFTDDDPSIEYLKGLPHPENLASSWGKTLSLSLRATFHCSVKKDNTNIKIIEDVKKWIATNFNNLIIIQWTNFINEDEEHNKIWELHQHLLTKNIPHIFFNGDVAFSKIIAKYNWGNNYVDPYDPNTTFSALVKAKNIDTISLDSRYFSKEAHSYWHRFLLDYIIKHNFI